MSIGLNLFLFLILLILSGIFSGSETALFGTRKENLQEIKGAAAKRTLKLLEKPQKLLIAILIGNTIVNIALTALVALLMHDLAVEYNWPHLIIAFIEIVVVTVMVLIFGEIIPKTVALRNTRKVSLRNSWFIAICYTVFFPLTIILYVIGKITERSLKVSGDTLIEHEEDIKTLVQIGEERGEFEEKEIEMITSLLESTDTCVREIMIPRPDMVAVDGSRDLKDIIYFVANQPFARFPVFEENLDNIKGFIFEKDVLQYLDGKKVTELENLLHPPMFLPEKCSVSHAISVFQEKKTKIAIVVDEYGGTSGLVTLEDAIEEIVGDIQDENEKHSPFVKWLTRKECAVNAAINLDDLEDMLELNFPKEHIRATSQQSDFGVADRANHFQNAKVHMCVSPDVTFQTARYEEIVERGWSLDISEQSGTLATFTQDTDLCIRRFLKGSKSARSYALKPDEQNPVMVHLLPPKAKPAPMADPAANAKPVLRGSPEPASINPARSEPVASGIATMHESPRGFLQSNVHVNQGAALNTKGRLKVGIRWRCACDLDLYVQHREADEPLSFKNVSSPIGRFHKDLTTSQDSYRAYEFVEFIKPVEARDLDIKINFFSGSAKGGATGDIRIWLEGQEGVWEVPFHIKAASGNSGKGSASSKHWVSLDPMTILGLEQ